MLLMHVKKIEKCLLTLKAVFKEEISRYPLFVERFEKDFASYIGCDYGISFCNGTSSIEAALFALGIGAGDEVIVPSCTFHASIMPILNCGAKAVFVDIDPNTLLIDPGLVREKISKKTKALLIVHLWGNVADMSSFRKIADEHSIKIIEDCSLAAGATHRGQRVGSLGDVGCFSLQKSKALAAGEGGIAVTSNRKYWLKMSAFGHFDRHSLVEDNDILRLNPGSGIGYKRRAHPLGILLAGVDLKYNDLLNQRRKEYIDVLSDQFHNSKRVKTVQITEAAEPGGYNDLIVLFQDLSERERSEVNRIFDKNRISYYSYPYGMHHKQPHFYKTSANPGEEVERADLPNTERLATQVCVLSCMGIKTKRLKKVCKGIKTILKEQV